MNGAELSCLIRRIVREEIHAVLTSAGRSMVRPVNASDLVIEYTATAFGVDMAVLLAGESRAADHVCFARWSCAVLLRDLCGFTHEQAAQRIGWSSYTSSYYAIRQHRRRCKESADLAHEFSILKASIEEVLNLPGEETHQPNHNDERSGDVERSETAQ